MYDTPVTDRELDQFYGVQLPAPDFYPDLIRETLTKTIRKVPHQVLSLPFIGGRDASITQTSIVDVITDECTSGKPLDALMAVIAGSDCPLVAKLREAIAEHYIYSNADDLKEFQS